MVNTDHRFKSVRRTVILIVALSLSSVLPAIAVDLNPGDLLVTIDAWPNPGKVLRIDPVTAQWTLIAEGNLLSWKNRGIAVDQNGQIVVAQILGQPVVRIDPVTGNQSVVAQGGLLNNTYGVAVAPNGDVLVSDFDSGSVIRIDTLGNQSTLVSGFGGIGRLKLGPDGYLYAGICSGGGATETYIQIDPVGGTWTRVFHGGCAVTFGFDVGSEGDFWSVFNVNLSSYGIPYSGPFLTRWHPTQFGLPINSVFPGDYLLPDSGDVSGLFSGFDTGVHADAAMGTDGAYYASLPGFSTGRSVKIEPTGDGATAHFSLFFDGSTIGNIAGITVVRPFYDCNDNSVADPADISAGASLDCNTNQIPDECEWDCNGNGVPDDCDLAGGTPDADANGILDCCELPSSDCNGNGVPDGCESDCNANGVPDQCDPEYSDTSILVAQLLAAVQDPILVCMFDQNGDATLNGQDIQPYLLSLIGP